MKTDNGIVSFKTYWGRYLIFSVVALLFSCGVFFIDDPDFPNKFAHLFFQYFGSHLLYWAVYTLISIQFMIIKKSRFSSEFYTGMAPFLLILAGSFVCIMGTYFAVNHKSLYPLVNFSQGLALILAGYHLYLNGKELMSAKSN